MPQSNQSSSSSVISSHSCPHIPHVSSFFLSSTFPHSCLPLCFFCFFLYFLLFFSLCSFLLPNFFRSFSISFFFFASSICFCFCKASSDVILSPKEASPMFLLLLDECGDFDLRKVKKKFLKSATEFSDCSGV